MFFIFPTKNITTTEGGMLTTGDKNVYNKVNKIIAHGIDKDKKKNFWNRSQFWLDITLGCPIILRL